jgi:hypothetical protein
VFQISVGFGMNRNSFDAQLFAGTQNAQRDFTTIGDYNLVYHGATQSMM